MEKFLVSSPAQLSQPFEMNSDSFIQYNNMDFLDPNATSMIMDSNYLQSRVSIPVLSPQNATADNPASYGAFSFQQLNPNQASDSSLLSSSKEFVPENDSGQDNNKNNDDDNNTSNNDDDDNTEDMVPKSDNSTLLHSSELMGPNQSLLNSNSKFSHSRNVSLDDGYYNTSFLLGMASLSASSNFARPPQSLYQSMHSTYRHHRPTLSTSSVASANQDPPAYLDHQYGHHQYLLHPMSMQNNPNLNTQSQQQQQSPSSYSMDSMHPLSSSISFQSFLESPQSFAKQPSQSQVLNTPRRHSRNKSLSTSSVNTYATPLRGGLTSQHQTSQSNLIPQPPGMSPVNLMGSQRITKTPYLAKGKGHSRSRSRMSMDATGAFLQSLSSQSQPSLPPTQHYSAPGSASANIQGKNPFFNSPIMSPGSQSNLDISSTATTPQHQPPSTSQRMQQANLNLGQTAADSTSSYRGSSTSIQSSYFTTPPSTSKQHLPYNPHIHQQPTNLLLSGFSGAGKTSESPTHESNPSLGGSAQTGVGNDSSTIIDAINIEGQDNDAFKQLKKAKSQLQISTVGRFLQPPPPPPKFMSDVATATTATTNSARYMSNVPEQGGGTGLYFYENSESGSNFGKSYTDMSGGGMNGSLLPAIDSMGDKYTGEDGLEFGLLGYSHQSSSTILKSAMPEEMAAALGEEKVKEINTLVGNEINLQSLKLPVKKNKKEKPFDPKKKHACPLCDAKFQRPEHVKRHMKSHSSEKPFQCEEANCGKRFNRKDNLKAHLKKIHQKSNS